MEVHRELGRGLLEAVYGDALEYEFGLTGIPYELERAYTVFYKSTILRHKYYADFVVFGDIILEIKACSCLTSDLHKQLLNYLAISKRRVGLLVNFGENSLTYRRLIL